MSTTNYKVLDWSVSDRDGITLTVQEITLGTFDTFTKLPPTHLAEMRAARNLPPTPGDPVTTRPFADEDDIQAVSDALDAYRSRHPLGRHVRQQGGHVIGLAQLAEAVERVRTTLAPPTQETP